VTKEAARFSRYLPTETDLILFRMPAQPSTRFTPLALADAGKYNPLMDEPRKFLESEVKAVEAKYAEVMDQLKESVGRYFRTRADLLAFRSALEAYTRNSGNPYIPSEIPEIEDSLKALFEQSQSPSAPSSPPARKPEPLPPIEKTTKSGVIYDIILASNGKGLKAKEIPNFQPEGLPFHLAVDDVYRALPRLVKGGKVWRDKQGRYYVGRQSDHMDQEQELFNESKEVI